jgi:hypothetical protein
MRSANLKEASKRLRFEAFYIEASMICRVFIDAAMFFVCDYALN